MPRRKPSKPSSTAPTVNGKKKPIPAKNKPTVAGELLTMDQAIEILRTTRATFYRWMKAGQIVGVKVGRQWRFEPAEIDRFLHGGVARPALRTDIKPLIQALQKVVGQEAITSTLPDDDDVQTCVKTLIHAGIVTKATDIHMGPVLDEDQLNWHVAIRLRIDGILHVIATFDIRLLPPLIDQIKLLHGLDVSQHRRPQTGRLRFKCDDNRNDIRASLVPVSQGEAVTLRILRTKSIPRLEQFCEHLNFEKSQIDILKKWANAPFGLVLIVGPAGCGKTTTMYACLQENIGPERKVMTAEYPIELEFPWATQIQVDPKNGFTNATALREIMRSDPDVIMMGEARDPEDITELYQAALTGHLVFSQMHTNNAIGTLSRLLEMGLQPFEITDVLKLVAAQHLVRKLCSACSKPITPSPKQLSQARELAIQGGLVWDSLDLNFHEPVGCNKCRGTGYDGYIPLLEMLEMSPRLADALARNASADELQSTAIEEGMITLAADGVRKSASGHTTLSETLAAV